MRLDRLQPHHIIELYDNLAEEGVKDDTSYTAAVDITKIFKERHMENIYAHAIKSADAAAADTLQDILNPMGKGKKA